MYRINRTTRALLSFGASTLAAALLGALVALAASAAAAAFAVPAAEAAVLTPSAGACDDAPLTRPFAQWADAAQYRLVPGGSFEGGAASWTLAGGAGVVGGNERFQVGGAGDGASLHLPPGSSAVSPRVCVGLDEPTLRLFARKNAGALSTLAVSVRVRTSTGVTVTVPIGTDLGGGWHPTLPYLMLANLLPLSERDRTAVQFVFTPLLGGDWQIDDVYVDPFRRM